MTTMRFTKEALEAQVGKEVPLTLNGQRIGTAKAVQVDEKGLLFSFEVDSQGAPGTEGLGAGRFSFGFPE